MHREGSASSPAPLLVFVGLGVAVVGLTALGPPLYRAYSLPALLAVMVLTGLVALIASRWAPSIHERRGLAIVLIIALAARIFALSAEPLLSTDIYRYVWDGRVQAAGINPYRYVPADLALFDLRDSMIYPMVNRAEYAHTAYPPVAQLFFFLTTRLGENIWVMRLSLMGVEAVLIWLLVRLLRALDRPAISVVSYAWHPLPIWEIANSGHVDALAAMLIVAGIFVASLSPQDTVRRCIGASLTAVATLVKPYAIFLAPVFWRPWDWKAPLAAILVIAFSYAIYSSVGAAVIGFVPGYLQEEGFASGGSFWLIGVLQLAFGPSKLFLPIYVVLILAMLAALVLKICFFSRGAGLDQRIYGAGILVMAGLFVLSPNYPWYYLIIVALIPLGAGAPAWMMSFGALGLNLIWLPPDIGFLLWKSVISIAFLIALFVYFRNGFRRDVSSDIASFVEGSEPVRRGKAT